MTEQSEIDAVAGAFKDFWRKIEEGVCPYCAQAMTLEEVEPCVYAVPCGHRLYQGELGKGLG